MSRVILGPKGHPPSYIMKSFRRFDRFCKQRKEDRERRVAAGSRIHTTTWTSTTSTSSTSTTSTSSTAYRGYLTTTTWDRGSITGVGSTITGRYTQDYSFEREERLRREDEEHFIRARAAWAKKQKIRRIRMKRRRIENE